MKRTNLSALALAALLGLGALALPVTAEAGHGWGGHGYYGRGWGGPGYWGAGLIGLGVGAAIGAAIAPPVVVAPAYAPPPAPVVYAPAYGPPAWTPEWYSYCAQRYRSFNARSGYFIGYDGQPHLCQ
jgi:BA14K-like protein